MAKNVLAFDFGASSGRAMLAYYANGRIAMEEVHRFSNDPVTVRGTMYWDVLRLFYEIKQGIGKAARAGGFDSIGIDTWAVDFGLLDKDGNLLENPVHYRDRRTDAVMPQVLKRVSKRQIYETTGIQFININTLYQLYSLAQERPELLARAERFLMMPDLFGYFLCGAQRCEYTNASSTQLLDVHTRQWSRPLIEALGLPARIFPPIAPAGSSAGRLSPELCEELGAPAAEILSVASHDTASAVVSVPATERDFIYISCGTWSLFGTELDEPIVSEQSEQFNLTNEGGYGGRIRYLKNIMGLWLIQESRRQWQREGWELSYADLEREALASPAFACFIDPDDPAFGKPGNLPRRVREYCQRTGQTVPESRGAVMRCIYESLALRYAQAFAQIQACTGKDYSVIHIVGGGTKDKLLCQLTANACGVPVVAGPVEATALGNVAVQLIAQGQIADLWEARQVIADSYPTLRYTPAEQELWRESYRRFAAITAPKN